MRLTIAAVGHLRSGPEAELVRDYLERAATTGRAIGIRGTTVTEVHDGKARGPEAQAARLLEPLAPGAVIVTLDERGRALDSPGLARAIAGWRDAGRPQATFLIGGADGHGTAARDRADLLLSLGPMVWPHMLVRVMLAEQLYRAVSILAGSPYHRGGA